MAFGVDEAGKGPVLGSMFAAAVVGPREAVPDDADDSKKVPHERRISIAETLREDDRFSVGVAEIITTRIDDPETDMNTLTVCAHAEALAGVASDGISGVVDAGDTDAERFRRRVADRVDAEIEVEARHGADEDDPLVAAASIIAKVERERHVETLCDEYGAVGSGYPSDSNTREFLESYVEANGDLPACARESWQTSKDALAAAEQAGLGDF